MDNRCFHERMLLTSLWIFTLYVMSVLIECNEKRDVLDNCDFMGPV